MAIHSGPVENAPVGGMIFGYIETIVENVGDFEAAATTDTVAMAGFPANAIPLFAQFNIGAYYGDGAVSITAATLQLGDAGDPNGMLAALDVFGTTALGDWTVGVLGVEAEYGSTGTAFTAAYAPLLLLTTTGENCDELISGHATCRLYYKRYEAS